MEPGSNPTFVCNVFYPDVGLLSLSLHVYDVRQLLQDIESRLSKPESEIVLWKVSTHYD
jgi:hypothetical protein